MQTLQEIGVKLAARRRALGLAQGDVAKRAGIPQAVLSRLERGHCSEFGTRKLMAILGVLRLELQASEVGASGNLDELRAERSAP